MQYWLIKSEPFKYSWDQFTKDGWTFWDGVKNYQARNNLRDMKVGDQAYFYHSNEGKEIVGIAEVIKTAYQDPTTDDDRWSAVDFKMVEPLPNPVTLAEIKSNPNLEEMALVKQSRLSVAPVTKSEWKEIQKMSKAK